ncbi:ABC transporter ATP-binding protein [Roseomonas sp. BN140053]|uniref:ABC transporter ATP-binding protein n=1 Tax=Roseomonas sp. BN140053 TaxID=3391898 RepID=UPI0039E82E4E
MSHLLVDAVSLSYGPLAVLRACSLSVERGTVLTLLGPSGCGKTTLLRAIAGFVEPGAGRIRVAGHDITTLPPERRQVGYVFQNYALFPHLTVADNVAYGLRIRRRPRREVAERVAAALELAALGRFADRYPAQLSGGQQQRVAVARALVLEPSVLLLDEPFSALDAQLRLTMQVELRKLIERVGITAVFVTHDQGEAMALSDTVAVMRDGRVEQVGPPLEIYDRPRTDYVAGFIGQANLLPVRVRGGAVLELGGLATALPDGAATLVVRPENLRLELGEGAGWPGTVSFSTALGPTVEYEVLPGGPLAGAPPLRAAVPRRAGQPPIPAGTAVRAVLADPTAAVLLPRDAAGVPA